MNKNMNAPFYVVTKYGVDSTHWTAKAAGDAMAEYTKHFPGYPVKVREWKTGAVTYPEVCK